MICAILANVLKHTFADTTQVRNWVRVSDEPLSSGMKRIALAQSGLSRSWFMLFTQYMNNAIHRMFWLNSILHWITYIKCLVCLSESALASRMHVLDDNCNAVHVCHSKGRTLINYILDLYLAHLSVRIARDDAAMLSRVAVRSPVRAHHTLTCNATRNYSVLALTLYVARGMFKWLLFFVWLKRAGCVICQWIINFNC